MVERQAGFMLPLMDHFVQQRLGGCRPAVAPQVPMRQHDGGGVPVAASLEFTESRLHPVGEPQWQRGECAAKVSLVEDLVQSHKPVDQWRM